MAKAAGQKKGFLNASTERKIPFGATSDNIQQMAQCYIETKLAEGINHIHGCT